MIAEVGFASPSDPIVAAVRSCRPFGTADWQPNNQGLGFANQPSEREFWVALGFELTELGDDPVTALANTSRIEICTAADGQGPSCPAVEPWVVYDAALQIGSLPSSQDVDNPGMSKVTQIVKLSSVDWDSPTEAGVGFFVRVNGQTPHQALTQGGACMNWERLAFDSLDPRVAVFGVPKDAHSPFLQVDPNHVPCNQLLESWTSGSTSFRPWCIEASSGWDLPEWIRLVYSSIADAHELQIQALVPMGDRIGSWWNGTINGVAQPIRIIVEPRTNAAGGGKVQQPVPSTVVDPNIPPTTDHAGTVALYAHELMHNFVAQWRIHHLGDPDSLLLGGPLIGEAFPTAQQNHLCIYDFPHELPSKCVSAGKLQTSVGDKAKTWLASPTTSLPMNALAYRYLNAAFWRYASEQFAHPLGSDAHPGGTATTLPRADTIVPPYPELDDPSSALGNRKPNEGLDFLGLYADHARTEPQGTSTLASISNALVAKMNRTLQSVVADAWTAWYLKDYSDSGDERWRYEWTGDFNNPSPIELAKPFAVPSDLYGGTPDGLLRARRVLDSWGSCTVDPQTQVEACTKASPRPALSYGSWIASSQPAQLNPLASAAFSVHPQNWAGKSMRVTASSDAPARFRVFKIQSQTGGKLVPVMFSPYYVTNGFDYAIPIDANTDEVLVLAVGGQDVGHVTWSFGPVEPHVTIVEPTTSMPAFIGHPEGEDGRRSFLMMLAVRDADNNPLPVQKEQVSIAILDGQTELCTIVDGDPEFQFMGLSGGHVLLVLTVPEGCYPTGDAMLELRATVQGITDPAEEADALISSLAARRQSTALVIDESGSMNSPVTKSDAAKIVLKAILRSMVPPSGALPTHSAALVVFTDADADTVFDFGAPLDEPAVGLAEAAVDGLTPLGSTSIGDGALEAQSLLAKAYDPLLPEDRPDTQAMIIASDGINTREYEPKAYYAGWTLSSGASDGNGAWYQASPLPRRPRADANPPLPLPRVSTIAIGQDADLKEMQALAAHGQGSFVYLPGPEQSTTLMSATLDFADRFGDSFNDASDYQRVASERVTGAVPALMPAIQVEEGAFELRVSVVSATESTVELQLQSPSGQLHGFTTANNEATVFRIVDPEPGTWTFGGNPGSTTAEPSVFVEGAVRSRVNLFAAADVLLAEPLGPGEEPPDSGRWIGSDVYLRAVPSEFGAMLGCVIDARVTLPLTKQEVSLSLHDDGQHHDGAPNDGNYGALFTQTGEAGLYDVLFEMSCLSEVSFMNVEREVRRGFSLHLPDGGDVDGDRLLDEWEIRYGFNPADPSDAAADADDDGLDNLGEFSFGTHPLLSDTDGDGEADGSEASEWRNPRDDSDGQVSRPDSLAIAGNALVALELGITSGDIEVQIERAPDENGPFEPYASVGWGQTRIIDQEVVNDTPICYRTRAIKRDAGNRQAGEMLPEGALGALVIFSEEPNPDLSSIWCSEEGLCVLMDELPIPHGAFSGWSRPTCTTPRPDPDPPQLLGDPEVRTGSVTTDQIATLLLGDPSAVEADDPLWALERYVVSSGVAEMRFDMTPTFENAEWLPVDEPSEVSAVVGPLGERVTAYWDPTASEMLVDLAELRYAVVFVQLRDYDGNDSIPFHFPVRVP